MPVGPGTVGQSSLGYERSQMRCRPAVLLPVCRVAVAHAQYRRRLLLTPISPALPVASHVSWNHGTWSVQATSAPECEVAGSSCGLLCGMELSQTHKVQATTVPGCLCRSLVLQLPGCRGTYTHKV